ncbi:4Fe-4S type ferredoxin protein [Azoarcus sp. KH32C]|nr:4Fe-4S type ferredoxin protein [Azoarcus sp. KH32C]
MTECAQGASDERRFACAEIAAQVDDKPGMQRCGERGAGCLGVGLVVEVRREGAAGIICRVKNLDHQEVSSEAADSTSLHGLVAQIGIWASELGFDAVAVADVDLASAEPGLAAWLADGFHGEMDYMARHGMKRARPAELVPGTVRVVSARMNYWPDAAEAGDALGDANRAYVSRYALGRDYHKLMRNRLQKLAERMAAAAPHGFRVFVDSAPVLEVELASRSGLGWRGKHTLLLDRKAGSYFFLGEIFTDLPLPVSPPAEPHCGTCHACLDACPTGAIVAPYRVDARRCISYLTIELKDAIPEELRPLIGNRIYGCDDCQLACPWNRFARLGAEADFQPRHGLDRARLVELMAWSEAEFMERMAGSAIYRIGYERWLRNLAVGLGNAPSSPEVLAALQARADDPSPLVREHVAWALAQRRARAG